MNRNMLRMHDQESFVQSKIDSILYPNYNKLNKLHKIEMFKDVAQVVNTHERMRKQSIPTTCTSEKLDCIHWNHFKKNWLR